MVSAAIASGNYAPHAAVMVPPLGVAIAAVLFKNKFTDGAIPFAATDPLKVIPAWIIGSALAGGLTLYFAAPHGGLFVLPIITHPIMYLF